MAACDAALQALDGAWRTETEIAARAMGGWSRSGIRHGLYLLASQRRVDVKVAPANGPGRAAVHVYRLAQPKEN